MAVSKRPLRIRFAEPEAIAKASAIAADRISTLKSRVRGFGRQQSAIVAFSLLAATSAVEMPRRKGCVMRDDIATVYGTLTSPMQKTEG